MEKQEHKYLYIADALRVEIDRGLYTSGKLLPSENTLAGAYGVSRVTARQALSVLEQEGLIVRKQGRGSCVADGVYRYNKARYMRIGMITWDIEDYMFTPVIDAARNRFSQVGFEMEIKTLEAGFQNKRRALQAFLDAKIDGLLVEGMLTALPTPNLDLYQAFARKGIPIVQMNGVHQDVPTPHIITDDEQAVAKLIDHLAALGHKKIGAIFNPTESQSLRRFKGYIDGLSHNSLEYADNRVLFIALKDFLYVFDNMFYARHRSIMECTALVCTNDIVARFLEATLHRAGVCVPQRMSLTGLDNAYTQQTGQSLLTTADFPARAFGDRAADMLLTMIRTGRDVENETLPMSIRIGNTTAPPSTQAQ